MSGLSLDAKRFLRTLKDDLKDVDLTPAQAARIREASRMLQGGGGITDERVEKVGKELKLTRDQRTAVKFALLVERLRPHLGADWIGAAHDAAQGVRHLAERAEQDPALSAAVETFVRVFVGADMGLPLTAPGQKAVGVVEEEGRWWVLGAPPPSTTKWTEVILEMNGGKYQLRVDGNGAFRLGVPHGTGKSWVSVGEFEYDAQQALRDAMREAPTTSGFERTFLQKAREQLKYGAAYGRRLPALTKPRLKSPPAPKAKAHERDAGAFEKAVDGWMWRPATKGNLGDPVPVTRLGVDALLQVKSLFEAAHTSADAIRESGAAPASAVELDAALGQAAGQRAVSEREMFAGAEERLRHALQGIPAASLDRDVFNSLVGAVTPKHRG